VLSISGFVDDVMCHIMVHNVYVYLSLNNSSTFQLDEGQYTTQVGIPCKSYTTIGMHLQ